jgi:hypothetical protein
MSDSLSCDDARLLLPDLALGIATGEERADVLRHLAQCPRCRGRVDALADVADELLLLVPPDEPPLGFESRVVERISTASRPRSRAWLPQRWRPVVALAAASVALAAGAGGAGVYVATEEERELGVLYRTVLEQAEGKFFAALPLQSRTGRGAGRIFVYEGRPSWVFVLASLPAGSGDWTVEVDTRSGRTFALGSLEVRDGRGTLGSTVPVGITQIARVRVVDERGATDLRAEIPVIQL